MKVLFISIVSLITLWGAAVPCSADTVAFNTGGIRLQEHIESWKELKMRNIVKQTHDYSCGPAALATIFTYHFNDVVTEKEIITYLLLTCDLKKVKQKKGFSLLNLKQYVVSRGYKATGYRMDMDSIAGLNKPVLVPINIRGYDHFVVFRGISGDRVVLADPVLGNLTMLVCRFMRIWKGKIGFVIEKDGYYASGSSLLLSDKEGPALTEAVLVQRVLSESVLGRIYADGEFR